MDQYICICCKYCCKIMRIWNWRLSICLGFYFAYPFYLDSYSIHLKRGSLFKAAMTLYEKGSIWLWWICLLCNSSRMKGNFWNMQNILVPILWSKLRLNISMRWQFSHMTLVLACSDFRFVLIMLCNLETIVCISWFLRIKSNRDFGKSNS